ncbi:DNA-binding transcriptional regulator CsiR [Dongshaea marina]|uniref:DNA-binding transcriptional regulator CsiR n=1 Tax=Dongshaea marina TaxID=2047966 RepID=UPI000D3ED7DE|nr:DNA-binding transcriptional regulator CsiR [Dongshaea marina]
MTQTPQLQSVITSENSGSQALKLLKKDILSGYFAPGEKLKMARLKERYQAGVTPLREALSQLITEQLVEVENQRGFRVTPIGLKEMLDIYEIRADIVGLCVRKAIERGDDIWEAGILAAAHRLKKAGDLQSKSQQEIESWELIHHEFHDAIVRGCASPTLLRIHQELYEKASRYRNLWLKHNMASSTVFEANQKEHVALVDALLARDPDRAESLLKAHYLSACQELQQTLPELLKRSQ